MKKCILAITFLISTSIVQPLCGQNKVTSKIIDYLIEKGDLDSSVNIEDQLNRVFVVDLLNYHDFEENNIGVFKFGTYKSHSESYILLNDMDSFQILRLKYVDRDVLALIKFLRMTDTSDTLIIKYIEAVLSVYQNNMDVIPWR